MISAPSKPNSTKTILRNCAINGSSSRIRSLSVAAHNLTPGRVGVSSRVLSLSGSSSGGLTYKDAGVDIDAGSELVRRITKMAPGIGGFGGLFPLGMMKSFAFLDSLNFFLTVFVLIEKTILSSLQYGST